MHIFVDESGTFVRSATKPGLSLVGALVIPDARLSWLERKYAKLRQRLPKQGQEVKGRLLSEGDVRDVAELLRKNDALLDVIAVDLNMHTDEVIALHKVGQAQGITKHLTEQHHPSVHEASWDLRRRLEAMTPQLYVQSVAMFELIWQATEHATLYFSQRQPKELAAFHWRIDAKNKTGVTGWEDWWKSVVMPMLQSKSIREPHASFVDGDYSHFERFRMEIPDHLPPADDGVTDGIDLRLLLMEDFRYSSDPEPGLEMIDILVNAVRRALIGHLRFSGWKDIRKLMIHRSRPYIRVIGLDLDDRELSASYVRVLDHFRADGRVLFAPRFARD